MNVVDAEQYTTTSTLFAQYSLPQKKKVTERGELLSYFAQKTEKPIGYIAMRLKKMHDLPTLYFIKSSADAYEQQGNPWSKCFYGMLKSY